MERLHHSQTTESKTYPSKKGRKDHVTKVGKTPSGRVGKTPPRRVGKITPGKVGKTTPGKVGKTTSGKCRSRSRLPVPLLAHHQSR